MLSLISSTKFFSRSETDDGFVYAIKFGRRNFIRLYFILYPIVLFFLLIPAVIIGIGVRALQNFGMDMPQQNLVACFFLIAFGMLIYILMLKTAIAMKKDEFRLDDIQKMRDFSVNFSVNKQNIDLKNTPQARVIQVKNIVNFTIRDQSVPDHYRNIRKEFLQQRMRLNSAEKSGNNAENIFLYDPFFEFLIAPKKYDVCVETDSEVVILGDDMCLKDARLLVEAIMKDASMRMMKKLKSKNFTEAYVLS